MSITDRLYNYFSSINTYILNEYSKLSPEKKVTTVALAIFSLLLGGSLIYSLHRFYQSKKLKPTDDKAKVAAEELINKVADKHINKVDGKAAIKNKVENERVAYSKQIEALGNEIKLTGMEVIVPNQPLSKWFGSFILEKGLPTGKGKVTYYLEIDKSRGQETRTGYFKEGKLHGLGQVFNSFRHDFQIHEGIFDKGIHVEGVRRGTQGWEEGRFGTPVDSNFFDTLNGEGKKFRHGILSEGIFENSELIKGKKTYAKGEVVLVE